MHRVFKIDWNRERKFFFLAKNKNRGALHIKINNKIFS